MRGIFWKSFLVSLVLLSIPVTMMGGVLGSSVIWADSGSYDGTIRQSILILVHGSAGASDELSLIKEPLESWGYPVEVFDHTEYYDLLGSGDHWYLHDQGGGHGDLDLVVGGDMQYSVIIFDTGDGLAYTDVETSSRAVRQMFEGYPFLGIARMESSYTAGGSLNNVFQIGASGGAAKNLTVGNPTGSWALEPLKGYRSSGTVALNISGKTSDVVVLEAYEDGTAAITLADYSSGSHAIYFGFKDWGYAAHVSMLVRLIQEYSGIPYTRPYWSFEVDDCGDPEVANADYISLCNWTKSNFGGYPTLGFIEYYLDPDAPAGIIMTGLDPSHYSNNTDFNPNNVALMAALKAYDDYVVASHGYQHDADWWQWTATGLPVDPDPYYGDEDSDGIPNWQDYDIDGDGVNNKDDPDFTMMSAGAFIEPDLEMQERWFDRMREVLDLYGYSDAEVLIMPKFEYLDGYTNSLAGQYGFGVISAKASNRGFEMTLGWVNGTYAPGRVAPSGDGTDADVALDSARRYVFASNFRGYIGKGPLCLVTNHTWQFDEGNTSGYELRDSYLSSFGVMQEAGYSLVSTQTAANKNIGWLWTDMTSVRNSDGSIALTLNSQPFEDGAARHELDIVMPYSIREVKVGSNYCIYVDGNELFYGKQSDTSETLQVLSGTYDSSLPRITSVSTPATDVLNAIYNPTTGKVSLMLDGTFTTSVDISNFREPFTQGTTSIGSSGDSVLTVALTSAASTASPESVNMSIVPSSGSVDVAVQNWGTSGAYLRQWTESSTSPAMTTTHSVGDLTPGEYYAIWYTKDGGSKTYWQTLQADGAGQISFNYDIGYSTVSFELAGAPSVAPDVSTSSASNPATVSATLNGNLTGLGTADSVTVSFQWGLTTSYGHETTGIVKGATGAFATDLMELAPGTTYHFRAKAVGHGLSYGDDVSFTTSTTPSLVTTGNATDVATTSATLNGNLTALGTAVSVNVSFEWGTSTSYGFETTAQSVTAVGAFATNLSGLTANTTYHFRTKAVGHRPAVYGEDMTFTTANSSDTTAPTISTVASSGIAKAEATITWITSESATSRVEYGLTEEYGAFTPADKSLVTSHSVGLTDLKAGKTYHYRVVSKDSAGNQAASADYTFKTESASGGMSAWAIIAVVVVGAVGGGVFFMKRGKAA